MKVLRTPDSQFANLSDYPYEPVYTNIIAKDGTELRIHHIDEGPRNGPILLAMHGQPVWSYLYSRKANQSGNQQILFAIFYQEIHLSSAHVRVLQQHA